MPDGKEVEDVEEVDEVKETGARRVPVRTYSDLLVYQQAYRLALDGSKMTRSFPRQEQYELGRQIRRSSRSVAANIVEGWTKRSSAAEFKRHLVFASGEAAETKFWLELAADEGIATEKACERMKIDYSNLGMMLHNLWKEWRKI